MRIIFFYIASSENGVFQNEGFNFSSNYNFYVNDIGENLVLCERNVPQKDTISDDFFSPAEDITAIVGKNGSGKTTLLKELCHLTGNRRRNGKTEQYELFFKKRYENNKRLVVIKDGVKLTCYHNIENLQIEVKSNISISNYSSNPSSFKDDLKDKKGPFGFSTIVATNGLFNEFGEVIRENEGFLDSILLCPSVISILGKKYFKEAIGHNYRLVGGLYEYLDRCEDYLSNNSFHKWLYIRYISSHKKDNFMNRQKWFRPRCKIRVASYASFVKDILNHSGYYNNEAESFESLIIAANILIEKILKTLEISPNDFVSQLYINLLFEALLKSEKIRETIPKIRIQNTKELEDYLKNIALDESTPNTHFRNAINEIDFFKGLIPKMKFEDNGLPKYDFGYDCGYVVDTRHNYENLDSIGMIFMQKKSFLLRYISIDDFYQSSGEKGVIDFFVRLDYISHNKNNNKAMKLKDNILVLFDEIDLLLHPEWERKYVYELTQACDKLLPGKHVQIIYTTHSPITLSDMPRGNVIFLSKNEDGKSVVEESTKHGNTFGNNIYLLYDDAFFLDECGQIGEFAKEKIRNLIKELAPQNNEYKKYDDKTISEYERRISIIGDDVIRNQLFRMLYRHQNFEITKEKSLLKRKIKLLEYEVERLKALEERL